MKTKRYSNGDENFNFKSLRVGDEAWVHANGETWVVDLKPKTRTKGGDKGGRSTGEVHAPMPGKILKVRVKVGDIVEAKHVLVLMDAMKMEYSLAAPIAGTVTNVACEEGQQVALDQLLVSVKPREA